MILLRNWHLLGAVWVLTLLCACGGGSSRPVARQSVGQPPTTAAVPSVPHQRPYTVHGKRYVPLASHQGFVEQGLASWYGAKFHGRRTSNGEIYNMYAMTAAHKTLPLGIVVRVRNLDNGREILVRLNDRGPFVKGRIIDLSYAAADKLGIVQPGTAPVRIEALGYPEALGDGRIVYRPEPPAPRGGYAVQVGSFSCDVNARRLAEELGRRYGVADVQRSRVGGSDFFRVRVGRFASLTEAESARVAFAGQGFPNSLIVAMD